MRKSQHLASDPGQLQYSHQRNMRYAGSKSPASLETDSLPEPHLCKLMSHEQGVIGLGNMISTVQYSMLLDTLLI